MEDEKSLDELAAELSEEAKELGKTAGKVALTAALATSLSAALHEPPNTDLMNLPTPTPLVQVLETEKPEMPKPVEEPQEDEDEARRQRILRLLKFLLIALLIAGTLLFGMLKGCTSCTAGVLLPRDDAKQEQQAEDSSEQDGTASSQNP